MHVATHAAPGAQRRNLQIEAGAVEVMPFARIRLRHRLRSPGFALVISVPPLGNEISKPSPVNADLPR